MPQITEEYADDVDAGDIIRTNPNAGYALRTGDTVVIYVSRGKSEIEVAAPNLLGRTEDVARETVKQHDLSIGNVTEEPSAEEKGVIIRQSASAGTMISSGTAIDIVVSSGSPDEPTKTGTHTLRLELPQEKESVSVKILCGTKTLFDGSFETALSPITVNLTDAVGENVVNIYVDDTIYKENVPVTFE